MKKVSSFKTVRNLLFFLLLAVFITSATVLALEIVKRQKGNRIYGEAKESFDSFVSGALDDEAFAQVGKLEADGGYYAEESLGNKMNSSSNSSNTSNNSEKKYNEALEKVRAALKSLQRINKDVCGWIRVEGTSIDYPIVKGEDNEQYLDHAYNGEFSPLGAIFADYRCDDNIADNPNTILYGHNLLTGAKDMFHDIELFFDENFFDYAEIVIYTFDGIYYYKPFSVYEARYDYNYYKINFHDANDFLDFASEIKANSRCDSGISFSEGDRILTLSTCTNRRPDTRYALHAKLINSIEE